MSCRGKAPCGNCKFSKADGMWHCQYLKVYSEDGKLVYGVQSPPAYETSEDKWDYRFLSLAEHIANWSKDSRTKVGAVIVDDYNRIIGLGYNGFPRGIDDAEEVYADRAAKLRMVVHAEANAILNANRVVTGCHLYVSLPPCNECTKLIIQAGIASVTYRDSDRVDPVATEMFKQAGVDRIVY